MEYFFNLKNQMFSSALTTSVCVSLMIGIVAYVVLLPKSVITALLILGAVIVIAALMAPIIVAIDIRNWTQGNKDNALYTAVVEDNLGNAKLLLRLGANPNAAMVRRYEDWDRQINWGEQLEHCIDAARSAEMKKLLRKYGATHFRPRRK